MQKTVDTKADANDLNDVFISYRHKDGYAHARLLYNYLTTIGYKVFFDQNNIECGAFPKQIDLNLRACKDFILIISPELFGNQITESCDWVFHEINTVLKRGKDVKILPLKIFNTTVPDKNDLPLGIRSILDLHVNDDLLSFKGTDRSIINYLKIAFENLLSSKPTLTSSEKEMRKSIWYDPANIYEAKRLVAQANNTNKIDMGIINQIISEYKNENIEINVLDVGCADGIVGISRFANKCFKIVVGIDKNKECLEDANENIKSGDKKFKYFCVDLEEDDFEKSLEDYMKSQGILSFDLIFAALVLHHLQDPVAVLRKLRKFLSRDGHIVVRGSDDGSKLASGDEGLVQKIIELSKTGEGIADRENGRKIYSWLDQAGYRDIKIESSMRDTSNLDADGKELLYNESFSYRIDLLNNLPICGKNRNKESANTSILDMQAYLLKLQELFLSHSFWYCEYDYIGIGQK
jgi:SAM-dependent methyltransferase